MERDLDEANTPISSAVRAQFDETALFVPLPVNGQVLEAVIADRCLADESNLQAHRFFGLASAAPDLLRLWVSQECVVTGPFSQLLLRVASDFHNVHLRAAFLQVVLGEHGPMSDGVARHSHPYLLYRLAQSVGLDLRAVEPLECTISFLKDVEKLSRTPLSALGVLGVGNERLLLTEYAAVRTCFDESLPESDYSDFLSSNIEEDVGHSAIAEHVAAALVSGGESIDTYRDGARLGVEARLRYYDELVEFWDEKGLPPDWLRGHSPGPNHVTNMEKP